MLSFLFVLVVAVVLLLAKVPRKNGLVLFSTMHFFFFLCFACQAKSREVLVVENEGKAGSSVVVGRDCVGCGRGNRETMPRGLFVCV